MTATQQGNQRKADHNNRKAPERKSFHRTDPSASRQEF